MTVIIALLGLIVLIAIHEAGHMLTAKAFGVRVPEYAIGFGPALFKKKWGETVYSFRIILLGGFARIAGMGSDGGSAMGTGGEDDDHKRRLDGRRLDEAAPPDTYYAKALWKRALIIFAGPAVNVAFAALILSSIFLMQGIPTQLSPEVRAVAPDTMAEKVGIQKGDRLVSMDGEPVRSWEGFTSDVESHRPGDEVTIVVKRDGERREFTGELGGAPGASPGAPERPLVGINPKVEEISHSPLLALWEGIKQTGTFIWLQVSGVFLLLTGQINFFDNVTGPVGIASIGGEVVHQGLYSALSLLAIISLILGVMNLIPILPLDGGHLLFIALEKIMRRPISAQTMSKVAAVGLLLVLTLFVFATYADLSKIFTGQPFIPDQ